jgi:hypothetical protein
MATVRHTSPARNGFTWFALGPQVIDRSGDHRSVKSLLLRDIIPSAGVAKLADAQDLKSWDPQGS